MVTVVDTFLITSSGVPSVTIWLSTVRGFSWQALRPTAAQHAAKKSGWSSVDQSNKGFSVGKAAVGAVLLGPVGLVGGALGKKTVTYYCRNCGFRNDYKPK